MDALVCKKCNIEKDNTMFNNSKSRKTGKRSYCKSCERKDANEFYKKNSEPYKKRAREFNKLTTRYYQSELLRVKRESKCAHCREGEICVLDFHHIDRTEDVHSRVNASSGFTRLQKELKKCIVLCANCHRKIHAKVIDLSDCESQKLEVIKYNKLTT